jgi:hypothetical protein
LCGACDVVDVLCGFILDFHHGCVLQMLVMVLVLLPTFVVASIITTFMHMLG